MKKLLLFFALSLFGAAQGFAQCPAASPLLFPAQQTNNCFTGTNQFVGPLNFYTDTGTANAYAITTTNNFSSLTAGQTFTFKAANSNTGNSTLKVDSVNVTIQLNGSPLGSGIILANHNYTVSYNGATFDLAGASSGAGGNPSGNVGDLQTKATSTTFGASHFNDTGSQLNASENVAFVGPRPWLDVTAPPYNAKGDGVTDDTAAIQSAITSWCAESGNVNGGSIYFPPGKYYVKQPQSPSTNAVFTGLCGGMHFLGGSARSITGVQFYSPPQVTITADCGASPNNQPVFYTNANSANGLTWQNLVVAGCNQAFLINGTNQKLYNVGMSAQQTGLTNNTPIEIADTFWVWIDGGSIESPTHSVPSMLLIGDNCGGFPGECPNAVGLLYVSNTILVNGPISYVQSSPATGEGPGHWVFRNVSQEDGTSDLIQVTNTGGAGLGQGMGPITLDDVFTADTVGMSLALINFNVVNGILSGVTINNSFSSGPAIRDVNGLVSNVITNTCEEFCTSGGVVDSSNLPAGEAIAQGSGGIAYETRSTDPTHLTNIPSFSPFSADHRGPPLAAVEQGQLFATVGVDPYSGFMFGSNNTGGYNVQLNQNSLGTVDASFAGNYPPTSVSATPSTTGGSLGPGNTWVYVVSTTGANCNDTSKFSGPSNLAGPYNLTTSTSSLTVSWSIPQAGLVAVTGYCVIGDERGQYAYGDPVSNFVSGGTATSATITAFPNMPGVPPITEQMVPVHRFTQSGLNLGGSLNLYLDNGSANAYNIPATVPTLSAIPRGTPLTMIASFGNTSAATLNVNSLGALAIYKCGLTALISGDIPLGYEAFLIQNSTYYELLNPVNGCGGSGGGGVSSFTGDGALLSNSASTGAVTATLNSTGAYNLWSNNTNATATPGYHALNSFPAAAFPTLNQNTTGTAGGLSGCTVTSAGSICYWNGTAWTVFAGNSSGTSVFQENASGVPSWGSGASTTFEANTTPLSSSSTVNFENSTSFNGLTATFANPSAGNVQLGFSGTLGNAGLTNSSLTVSTSSPLSGGGLVSLGGSLSLSCPSCVTSLPPFETNGTNNTSQALLNFANTSGAGEIDFTNPSGGIEQATLHNTATTVNSQTCTLGSTCTVTAAPSGSAGGDLGSTYPNPTVVQIEGGVIPVSAAVVGTNSSKQPIAATAHGIASPLACSDTSGSGTAQSCTSNPSYTPASGDWIIYKTTTANTGDVTVNVNSTSAAHVRKWQGSSVLASGDLAANIPMLMQYDGTFWELYTIGNAPSGSGFANPMTTIGDMIGGGASGAATRIPAGLTGQVPVATNGSAPAFASPGLPDSANSPVTSSYTLAADTATAIVDRAHTLRFQSGSATCTVPAISTTGVGVGFVTALMGDGAGTVTCSRSSTDSFSVFNGATNSDSQTSFTFANGDFVSLSAAATGVWEVRITHQGSGGSGCSVSGTQYQLVTVASGGTSCTPANVQVDSTLNNLVFPTPSGTTYGTVTTLHTACYTGSQQIGNCGTSATNVLGVFVNSSGGYQATGWLSGIVLDGTQSPAYGDILCASTTTGGEVHDNGSTLCGAVSFIGIVSTSATSVTTVSAWLAVKTPNSGTVTGGTCTNQVTTAISTSGVPTCTTVTGAYMASNTVTATQLAAQYSKGSCTELWGGSGTSFALSSGDDAIADNSCYNDSGATRTITAVKCRSDIASNTTTVNPTFGSAGTGTTILSGALTCGSSLAYSSTGTVTNASWTTGTGINPVQGGTLTGTSIAVIYEYTY